MSTSDDNKNTVNRFFEALNAGDVGAIVELYDDDGFVQTMGSTLISGKSYKKDIRGAVEGIYKVFPDGLKFNIVGMVAEGDRVAVEANSSGEHISGQTYANEYHFLFEFSAGKLVKLREYMDTEQVTDVLCGGQRPPFST